MLFSQVGCFWTVQVAEICTPSIPEAKVCGLNFSGSVSFSVPKARDRQVISPDGRMLFSPFPPWLQLFEGPHFGQQPPTSGRPHRLCLLSLCVSWNLDPYFSWINTFSTPSSSLCPSSPSRTAAHSISLLPYGFQLLLFLASGNSPSLLEV